MTQPLERLKDIPTERICSNPDCDNIVGYRPPSEVRKSKTGKFYCSKECHTLSKRSRVYGTDSHKKVTQTVKVPMAWKRKIEEIVANDSYVYPSTHAFCKIAIGKLIEYESALMERRP